MAGSIGFILVFGLIWGLPIFVSHKVGAPKRRAGWAYGLLLGWLGVVVIACLGPKRGAKRGSSHRTSGAGSWSAGRERSQRSPLPKSELRKAFAIFAGIVVVGVIVIAVGLRLTNHSASATPVPTPLSHAQLVRTANSDCLQARREFDKHRISVPRRPNLRTLLRFFRIAVPRIDKVAGTLSGLAPPSTDQVSYQRLLNALAAEGRAGGRMLHDLETRQVRSGLLVAREVDAIEKRARRLERKLGITACMKLQ
jgi:hypothetical protein